jgi:hypothetical protein
MPSPIRSTARPRSARPPRPDPGDAAISPNSEPGRGRVAAGPGSWPSGPLDAADRAFDLLTRPPAPLAFDCWGITGLPQRLVALDELKRLLLSDGTPRPVRDVVWRELVTRARRDGPAWVVAAAGLAMPGLRRRAGLIFRGWAGEREDLDSELLLGFLERLRTIDVDAGNICARLIEAGARQAQRSWRFDQVQDLARDVPPRSLPPARPWDHPDFVLARAVAAAVVGPEECFLIAQTRLEDVSLEVAADRLGVPASTASSWRRRAEHRLREAIADGELRWTHLSPTG